MGELIYLNRRVRHVVTIHDVAKTFLNMESMSPKKLQKLCFYAYSWYLTYTKQRLFPNNFEAWIHGPVDPALYQQYKEYGYTNIPREETVPASIAEKPQLYDFIESVYNSYGHLTADQLEYLTHMQRPWLNARAGLQSFEWSNNPIKDEDIIAYHTEELANAKG